MKNAIIYIELDLDLTEHEVQVLWWVLGQAKKGVTEEMMRRLVTGGDISERQQILKAIDSIGLKIAEGVAA